METNLLIISFVVLISVLVLSLFCNYYLFRKREELKAECDKFKNLYIKKDAELTEVNKQIKDNYFDAYNTILNTIQELARRPNITNNPIYTSK